MVVGELSTTDPDSNSELPIVLVTSERTVKTTASSPSTTTVLSTTVSSRVNDKFNSLLSDQEDDFNKKLDNAKVLLINNVPASILSDFNNGQLQNVVDDDEIVVVDIDKDVFETDLIPGQASSADIVQVNTSSAYRIKMKRTNMRLQIYRRLWWRT